MISWEMLPALAVLIVGIGLFIRLCLRFPPALVLGVVAYSMISKSASVAYLETTDVYLIEVGMTSHTVGAAPRQIFYNLFIFVVALSLVRWIIKWQRPGIDHRVTQFGTPDYNRELRLALIASAGLLGVQLVNAIISPPYALPGLGVDRLQFWANIRFPLLADLVGVLVIFVPAIAGVAFAYGKVTDQFYFRRFSIILMLVYGLYFVLTGARFNGSLMALLFWLSSYWIVLWVFGKKLQVKNMGLLVMGAVSAFLVVGYFDIADRGIAEMTGSTWEGFLYRIFALQGNVYFAADVLASAGERHSAALLLGEMSTTLQAYMPSTMADAYLDRGVNLAGSLPGNSIYVFGHWVGLLPMAAYAIILGLISGLYTYIVASGRFLLILPAAYLCLWTYSAYTQGSFSHFLDYKFYLFIGLLIVLLMLPSRNGQHRRTVHAHPAHSTKVRS